MANEKITKTIEELDTGKNYNVHYSTFKRMNGKHGSFMKASFIVSTDGADKAWFSITGDNAVKAVGIMTSAIFSDGAKANITNICATKNGDYTNYSYVLQPYVK